MVGVAVDSHPMAFTASFFVSLLVLLFCGAWSSPLSRSAYQSSWLQDFAADLCEMSLPLVAHCAPTDNSNVRGELHFEPMWENQRCQVRVRGNFEGLKPLSKHGIHIHMYGDIGPSDKGKNDGMMTGGHYDKWLNHDHALPTEGREHHSGDLGNLVASQDGKATYELVADFLDLSDIRGRGVVVHAEEDKGHAEQPTGGAGARVATGVIGYRFVRPEEESG